MGAGQSVHEDNRTKVSVFLNLFGDVVLIIAFLEGIHLSWPVCADSYHFVKKCEEINVGDCSWKGHDV